MASNVDPEKKSKDYTPPGWLITNWNVKLDPEQAKKLEDFRVRICDYLGKDNEICNPKNLFAKAVDLLIANEPALLTKVEYDIYNVQGGDIEKPVSGGNG